MVSAATTYALLFFSLYFEVFLLVAFLERKFGLRTNPAANAAAELPSVAIIVPCFNEEKTVAATLESLCALEYPAHKLELIVVDDGSRDNTFAVAEEFAANNTVVGKTIRVFRKENGGKHSAMNFALEHTNAQLVGCLDADSTVISDALMQIAPLFATEPQLGAVVPSILVKNPRTLLQHMQYVEYRLSVFNRFAQAALGSAFITPGPFSIFRTEVVRKLGGWRAAHSTEDMELALRLQRNGYLIGNAPAATVLTNTPPTLRRLFRQRVRWMYGFFRNVADYRSMLWSRSYGNLTVILLAAVISIGTGLYFFARMLWSFVQLGLNELVKVQATGSIMPHFGFDLFYVNTSALWFIIWTAILLSLVLVMIGSYIGTGKRLPPAATPIFFAFYPFLAPFWLGTALVRAVFKTGVRWR